ncbi:TPA: hypothetical protein KRE72_002944 [Clostridioides difficile]|uniref:hypothetical protein n=1 Tax=Clostridioides difficile TaxID=1496 RepID=UPI00093D06D8|nr:hypothetical protein [Clostridioides difficile]MBY2414041.1 hypothetical protein [Clostridioides difficile]MCR1707611.1 hypothetical protein [Clostridioides difficile]MDL0417142.1 hypothetical protein [Clostridioides difficile]MDV9440953.1 hypothetical protein [Clostridioides difficile]MDV9929204.1 hypothetical protein [Clostridioides difficile]
MISLREYIDNEIGKMDKDDIYYNESFCNIVDDYLSSVIIIKDDDIIFLKENEYSLEDFLDEEHE